MILLLESHSDWEEMVVTKLKKYDSNSGPAGGQSLSGKAGGLYTCNSVINPRFEHLKVDIRVTPWDDSELLMRKSGGQLKRFHNEEDQHRGLYICPQACWREVHIGG
jgi:hypothetical protein